VASTPKELITLQSLSKRLGIKVPIARELRRQGKLQPDFFMRHFLLYKTTRIPALIRQLQKYGK
jgi:hypothetical protein